MEYYSLEDIETMKRNGYEKETIDKARSIQEKADALIKEIHDAFNDVTLGDGVGLDEAQGIDGYETKEQCLERRKKDEKESWASIKPSELNRCNSSLSFFDAKGMQFHLPAYLVADIKDLYIHDIKSRLINLSDHEIQKFNLLTKQQKDSVCSFLNYTCSYTGYTYHIPEIESAINDFWSK